MNTFNMIALKGTEKQIKWANDIRVNGIQSIIDRYADIKKVKDIYDMHKELRDVNKTTEEIKRQNLDPNLIHSAMYLEDEYIVENYITVKTFCTIIDSASKIIDIKDCFCSGMNSLVKDYVNSESSKLHGKQKILFEMNYFKDMSLLEEAKNFFEIQNI